MDGRHIKSIFSFDGPSKLVNEQRDFKTGELQCIGIRELDENNKLVEVRVEFKIFVCVNFINNFTFFQTLTAGEVIAKRIYVKQS